jgi:hypothetical protein
MYMHLKEAHRGRTKTENKFLTPTVKKSQWEKGKEINRY